MKQVIAKDILVIINHALNKIENIICQLAHYIILLAINMIQAIRDTKSKIILSNHSIPNIRVTLPSIQITMPTGVGEDDVTVAPNLKFTLTDALNDGVSNDVIQCINDKYPLLAETTVRTNCVDGHVVRVIDVCCYKKYHNQVHSDLVAIYSKKSFNEKVSSLDAMLRITITYE